MASYLAKSRGNNFTFLTLAAIAAVGLAFFWALMSETCDQANAPGLGHPGAA